MYLTVCFSLKSLLRTQKLKDALLKDEDNCITHIYTLYVSNYTRLTSLDAIYNYYLRSFLIVTG
jgi:hypothetical protein